MSKDITKFSNELYATYLGVLKKVVERKVETSLSMTAEEVSIYVTERMNFIRKNGGIMFKPEYFDVEFSRLSSVKYNRLMHNIKVDIEAVITQILDILDLSNIAEYMVQHDFRNIISFANDEASRIRNLKTLLNTNKEFNGYISDTLNTDDNTYDGVEYKAHHSHGMYKIQPFLTDPVADDENDAVIEATILNDNISIVKDVGNVFSNSMLDGKIISMFAMTQAVFSGTMKGDVIDYKGLLIAFRIKLPDIKQINNLSFRYFSTDNIDIVKILYSTIGISSLESEQWQEVEDIETDELHFGSKEINFPTVFAKEMVVIIGQKFVTQTEISIDTNQLNKFVYGYNLENTLENHAAGLETARAIIDDSQLSVIKRDKTMYALPSKSKNLEDKLYRMIQSFIDGVYGSQKRLNDFNGYMYYINMFSLRVNRYLYKQFSVYESDVILATGSLINARLSKNDKIPDGTAINYYILYNDKKIRALKKGDAVRDMFVIQKDDDLEYKADFLIDTTKQLIVRKNNETFTNYVFLGLHGDIAVGIRLDTTPKYGDIYVLDYSIPEFDQFGSPYFPWNVNIIKTDGYPNIKHADLINIQNLSRILLKTDNHVCCYPISSRLVFDDLNPELKYFYLHKDDVYEEQVDDIVSMQDPADPDANFYLHDMEEGATASGTFYKIPQKIEVSGVSGPEVRELVVDVRKDIYYGIIDEQIEMETDYEDVLAINYITGNDQELTLPDDVYSTVPNFMPLSDMGSNIEFFIGGESWNLPVTSGIVGQDGVWTGSNNTPNTYGIVSFKPVWGGWYMFANDIYNGLKEIVLPKTGSGTTDGGKVKYYYHRYAWRNAFDPALGGVGGATVVVAKNGSVYQNSIYPAYLVVTHDGKVGPAGGGYASDDLHHIDPDGLQPQEFYTEHEYIPGTLVCRVDSIPVPVGEYSSADPDYNLRKDPFNIQTGNLKVDSLVETSYIPIDIATNADAETNLIEFNEFDRFEGTDSNATVVLQFAPYIDTTIVALSTGLNRVWYVNDNVFALKDNVSVIYKPIEVKIDGIEAANITDYINSEKPTFKPFDIDLKNYEFYMEGKVLYFNTNIIAGNVEVRYYKLNDRIKLRTELYRFNTKRYDLTPEVHDIMVLTNTI